MPGVRAVAASDGLPADDASWTTSQPAGNFGTTLDTIPAPGAYLAADPTLVQTWRARLHGWTPEGTRRIGLAFAGNPKHRVDRRRSIPPDFSIKLPAIPGIGFVNLQHGASGGLLGLPDLTPWLPDYAATAGLIENLDLVITVDTSVAHLAGAMGKPVWIMLPHAPDWRWLQDRSDSPWYRSVRLFRQPAPGDWASVLRGVMQALASGQVEQSTAAQGVSVALWPPPWVA